MCKFFSVDSDGKGNVFFFTVEEVAKIMAEGNPKDYEFNSHTSIADKSGFKGEKEDKLNKWEYDPDKDELVADRLVVNDDREKVLEKIKNFFSSKDKSYLRNLYNRNSGDLNSGDLNSGDLNSGDLNSGDLNSGNWNSGNRNSGNRNSGNWNSGNRNSGDLNSGDLNYESPLGSFCSERRYFLFNKNVTESEYRKIFNINWSWFVLTEWILEGDTGGHLEKHEYKEAWSKCPPEVIEQIMALPKFNAKVFEKISGIKVGKRAKK